MSESKRPIIFYGPDFCKKCNTRSIEIFDFFNTPMNYQYVAKDYMDGLPNRFAMMQKKTIYKMKCRNCGTSYNIRWDRGYPVPDLYKENDNFNAFITEFKEISHENIPRAKAVKECMKHNKGKNYSKTLFSSPYKEEA